MYPSKFPLMSSIDERSYSPNHFISKGSIKNVNTIKMIVANNKLFKTVLPVIFCPIPNLAQLY